MEHLHHHLIVHRDIKPQNIGHNIFMNAATLTDWIVGDFDVVFEAFILSDRIALHGPNH
jgi:hypothetical protein